MGGVLGVLRQLERACRAPTRADHHLPPDHESKASKAPRSRAQGGRLPLGYQRTRAGGVEVDPDSAAEVARVFDLVRDGASVRKAAEAMSAETGRPWMPTTVARIVGREEYKRAGEWRIIHPKVWNAAQDALAKRRRHPAA